MAQHLLLSGGETQGELIHEIIVPLDIIMPCKDTGYISPSKIYYCNSKRLENS